MFRAPGYWHNNSLKIASVLEDIGVNERMVLKRRRSWLVSETISTITSKLIGKNRSFFHLGSQSEGTTTPGLKSDVDTLICSNDTNVIHLLEEWQPGAKNLMVIQDENTTPGYCFLQHLYSNVPLPVTVNETLYEYQAIYKRDKVILKNTYLNIFKIEGHTREGAAITSSGMIGQDDCDHVYAFPFKYFPRSVGTWLNQQVQTGNISSQMKRYIESNPCLVVMTGCKGSPYAEYEWRISTSFIERCLMFNLNITQLQCYVMMKLTLKTYLNYSRGKLLSSFMCKNILLICIQCISFDEWQPQKLLHVFTFCLLKLKQCVLKGECPHFIIHGNNLLRRKLTTESKQWLVDRIDFVIQSHGCAFLCVRIDDFDHRLKSKFNIVDETSTVVESFEDLSKGISGGLIYNVALDISTLHTIILDAVMSRTSDLCSILRKLSEIYFRGSYLEQCASRLLTPLLCSTLGFIKASDGIYRGNSISSEALTWIYVGLHSDVASSILKLASVLYCMGDMNGAEKILTHTKEQYQLDMVAAVCQCYVVPGGYSVSQQFAEFAASHNEDAIQHITAFCVRFLPSEINCIPHELRYEMFRSTPEDMPHRGRVDYWMDWAVIDSLPYLYFLKYKTCSRLRGYHECLAISNFANSIFKTTNLGHRETALNLLGQCMEQENRYQDALNCYVMSLRVRQRNNVAKIHVCRLLSSLLRS